MGRLDDVHSFLASTSRIARGWFVFRPGQGHPPDKQLVLYDFEACPYCRKVRETLSELDLEYLQKPCARGSRHRAEVEARGGKRQFPFLVDPNERVALYESEDIIDHLHQRYGATPRTRLWRAVAPLNTFGSAITSALRPRARHVVGGAIAPERPLVLYNFEMSPYCRKAREALCELDLPYVVKNVARGSVRRGELVRRGGRMMVPYLIDPNSGFETYESDDIVAYLHRTYRS